MNLNQLETIHSNGYAFDDCIGLYDKQDAVFKRGRIHIDFGRTGEGKTTLITQRCLAFAAGLPFGNIFPLDAIPNILINTEQTKEEFNRRYLGKFFEKIEKSNPLYKRIEANFEFYDSSVFSAAIGDHKKTLNTIIDTLEKLIKRFRSDKGIDESRLIMLTLDPACVLFPKELGTGANAISYITNPLRKLSERLNVAIAVVMHTHKARDGRQLELTDLQGSYMLAATVDSIFAYESPNGKADPMRQIRCLKGEMGAKYCENIYQDENNFFGTQTQHISPFDDRQLRTLPPTKSKDLYALLKAKFHKNTESKKHIEYMLRSLVKGGIIAKESGKNVYKGCYIGGATESKNLELDEMLATDDISF